MEIAHTPAAGDGLVQYRSPGHLFNILAEITDGEPLRDRDIALIRNFVSHNHAKQSRLARSIRPHQADLLPGIELERRINKNQLLTVLLVDIGKRDHFY